MLVLQVCAMRISLLFFFSLLFRFVYKCIFLTRFSVCVYKRMAGWCTIYKMVCAARLCGCLLEEKKRSRISVLGCECVYECSAVMVPHAADVLVPMSIYWSCVYADCACITTKDRYYMYINHGWQSNFAKLSDLTKIRQHTHTHTTQGCITYMPFPMNF